MDDVKLGDGQALGVLVEKYQDRLVSFLYNYTGDFDLSADLAQEAFVRVFVHAKRYTGIASFSSWLYRIGLNLAIDELRRRNRFRWIPFMKQDESGREREIKGLPSSEHPEQSYLREERKRLTRGAVSSLPAKYRAALVLKDIEEMPYEEVAHVLGCPLGTVKSRINRARMLLKGKMEGLLGTARQALPAGMEARGSAVKPNRVGRTERPAREGLLRG